MQKQNVIKSRVGIAATLAVLLSGLFSPLASAATANPDGAFNIVVSPPSVGIEAKPGESTTTEIRIQNQGIATEQISVDLLKFTAEGSTGLPKLQELQPGDDFASWAHFSTTSFSAEPNEWKSVKVTISPPKDAAFGYYYAVLFSRTNATKTVQKSKANLLASVASLLLVDVKSPNAVRKVNVSEFSTSHKTLEFLPVTFKVKLHNTGNIHVASRGTITISRGGKPVATLDVNSQAGYVLPNSFRDFSADWKDGTPVYTPKTDSSGKILVEAGGKSGNKLDWDKFSLSKLRIGKYDARLVMIYNDGKGNTFTEARLSFWVIPWRIIAGVVLVLLFVLAGVWALVIRPLRGRVKKARNHVVPR
jgi:hypothetical protein